MAKKKAPKLDGMDMKGWLLPNLKNLVYYNAKGNTEMVREIAHNLIDGINKRFEAP